MGMTAFIAVCLYLLEVWVSDVQTRDLYSSLALLLLPFCLWRMRKVNLLILIMLLVCAGFLFLHTNASWYEVLYSFGENMSLLGLFLLVPLFGITLNQAGYYEALSRRIQAREAEKGEHPYRLGYGLTVGMGSVLNLGSLPLIYHLGEKSLGGYRPKLFGMTLLRGFGFCMLVSPYFVNVGLVLVLYDLAWTDIALYGMVSALVYTLVVVLFFPVTSFSNDPPVSREHSEAKVKQNVTTRGLIMYILLMMVLSLLLEAWLPLNMLAIVTSLSLIYPFVWAIAKGIFIPVFQAGQQHLATSYDRVYNEMGIFITAGVLGTALERSDVGPVVSQFLYELSQGYVPLIAALVLLLAIILALVGIHPVIIVIGLGQSLSPELFGIAPEVMAVLLLSAWTLGTQISPFSGSVLMAAHLTDESAWRLVQKNIGFVALMFFISSFLITVFHMFS
ncbi:hypothetical protein B0H94_103192 [Salsuginibacillus halophilus]|uniref:Uncharacterized protein n=1 Tax=Salsuginibacillus halophilus TaxID=517424 RepID=A0A2P8HWI3_9BACI|nr:hypothetical protein B0H94_103192 [Salsuginibacillus halophilus]